MTKVSDWNSLVRLAAQALCTKKLGQEYKDRLAYEIKEINKQGANRYWINLFNEGKKHGTNKNGLVLPFLLDISSVDPIASGIKHKIEYHADFPDIDIDFLPIARDPIKKYAEEKYGSDYVCTVGMWIRYKTKLALQDAATALGKNRHEVVAVCKNLPEEFDIMPFEQAYEEYENFRAFADDNPELVALAYGMSGKIKAQSKHAGGLIISSVPIRDYVPLTYSGKEGHKQWASAWTEGMADTQLSKFGFVKFDILGLINISYIWNCIKLIKRNRGDSIDFDDIDPEDDRAGWVITANGERKKIRLNDPDSLKAADELKLTSIFQFDTDFQMSVVEKGGVRSFTDLVIYTSLGRPGPLPMIDVYIKNRDDPEQSWKKELHPIMLDILGETQGVITFQEQLLRTWVELCGMTMPEAEAAQKAVKKKKAEILDEIAPKVIEGAKPLIGEASARELWDKMVSFGRYCFNKSHAVAYIIISYRCLWLKTHYPAEWWAAVLSDCPAEKFVRYMSTARVEGIKFGAIDVTNLSLNFTVRGDHVLPGITSIKGIGGPTAEALIEEFNKKPFTGFEDFTSRCGSSKTVLERLIKLGGFDKFHSNRRALWMWYLYEHGSGKDASALRHKINWCYAWPQDQIIAERQRQAKEFTSLYPKKKTPKKIWDWIPSSPKSEPTEFNPDIELNKEQLKLCKKINLKMSQVTALFSKDFRLGERLEFEKQYLGYYWSSPLDAFKHSGKCKIADAKESGVLECVIEEVTVKHGNNGDYLVLNVTDGMANARVNVWANERAANEEENFAPGTGVRMQVLWKDQYNSFSLKNRTQVVPLESADSKGPVQQQDEEVIDDEVFELADA